MQSRRIRQSPGYKTDRQTTEGLGENRLIGRSLYPERDSKQPKTKKNPRVSVNVNRPLRVIFFCSHPNHRHIGFYVQHLRESLFCGELREYRVESGIRLLPLVHILLHLPRPLCTHHSHSTRGLRLSQVFR